MYLSILLVLLSHMAAMSASLSARPSEVIDVQRGLYQACALFSSGKVMCWGDNRKGQLGTGNRRSSPLPVAVPGVDDASSLWVHDDGACVIRRNGGVACWGVNANDGAISRDPLRATTIPDVHDAVKVVFGGEHACVLLRQGNVMCWGHNDHGQLGQADTRDIYWMNGETVYVSVPVVDDIFADDYSTCALLTNGEVDCWGGMVVGSDRLNDSRTMEYIPVSRVDGVSHAIAISHGSAQCALIRSGQVRCWGDNRYGELGDGTVRSRARAAPVVGVTHAKQLLFGTCAVLANGRLACWGSDFGLPTNGDPSQRQSPSIATTTPFLRGAKFYSMDYRDLCAIMPDGHVHCHQPGDDGDWEVGNLANVVSISVGAGGGCALTKSHEVRCWGDNPYGELGNGKTGSAGIRDATGHFSATPVVGLDNPDTITSLLKSLSGLPSSATTPARPSYP